MSSTAFVDGSTLTAAAWFNDVDTFVYSRLTSVSGTNTIVGTGPVSMTAYATGQRFTFIPANTNTGAATVNITPSGGSALGAKNIFAYGAALTGGELVASVPAEIMYDGTQFNIINPQPIRDSYTGTLTGCDTTPTQSIKVSKDGNVVTVDSIVAFTGTSNAATKTVTGMPSQYRPATAKQFVARLSDNGGANVFGLATVGTNGTLTFFTDANGTGWTSSGTATISTFCVTYTTN